MIPEKPPSSPTIENQHLHLQIVGALNSSCHRCLVYFWCLCASGYIWHFAKLSSFFSVRGGFNEALAPACGRFETPT